MGREWLFAQVCTSPHRKVHIEKKNTLSFRIVIVRMNMKMMTMSGKTQVSQISSVLITCFYQVQNHKWIHT